MSKFGKVSMIMALVAMMATPALAEFSLSGYYRLQGISRDYSGTDDRTTSFIDQRLRMKLTKTFNDYVAVVYYGEVDAPFGERGSTPTPADIVTESGGTISSDGVNVETKNMYIDFKIPNTTWAVRTGLQGWDTGNEYESMVVADDMAAINARGEIGPAVLDLIYSKWNEGARTSWDERDFYAAKLSLKPTEQLSLGALAMYLDDNRTADDQYWWGGVNGDFRFADFGVKSFFLFGDADQEAGIDGNSWIFDVAGFTKLPNGNIKLHAAYIPDDEEAGAVFSPGDYETAQGGFEYHNDNLMIFMTDIFYNNDLYGRNGQGAIAFSEAAYQGNGLWFVTVSGDQALPQDSYLKYGAGYFSAVEDDGREGSSLGAEVAAMVGKKFAEIYDLSLRGSYAFVGDYFDFTDPTVADLDEDLWKAVAMLNVAF